MLGFSPPDACSPFTLPIANICNANDSVTVQRGIECWRLTLDPSLSQCVTNSLADLLLSLPFSSVSSLPPLTSVGGGASEVASDRSCQTKAFLAQLYARMLRHREAQGQSKALFTEP